MISSYEGAAEEEDEGVDRGRGGGDRGIPSRE